MINCPAYMQGQFLGLVCEHWWVFFVLIHDLLEAWIYSINLCYIFIVQWRIYFCFNVSLNRLLFCGQPKDREIALVLGSCLKNEWYVLRIMQSVCFQSHPNMILRSHETIRRTLIGPISRRRYAWRPVNNFYISAVINTCPKKTAANRKTEPKWITLKFKKESKHHVQTPSLFFDSTQL